MIGIYKQKLERLRGRRQEIEATIFNTNVAIRNLRKEISISEKAQAIIQKIAQQTQKQIEYRISDLASLCLSIVFKNPYKFVCRFKGFGKKNTHCDFLFERGGNEVKPQKSSGGGACNVAAMGLRCTVFYLNSPRTRNILFVEEPFLELKGKAPNIRALKLINKLSRLLNTQIIMIGDERVKKEIIAKYVDKVFETSLNKNGVTEITEIC